jgi:hypothetical protein
MNTPPITVAKKPIIRADGVDTVITLDLSVPRQAMAALLKMVVAQIHEDHIRVRWAVTADQAWELAAQLMFHATDIQPDLVDE